MLLPLPARVFHFNQVSLFHPLSITQAEILAHHRIKRPGNAVRLRDSNLKQRLISNDAIFVASQSSFLLTNNITAQVC